MTASSTVVAVLLGAAVLVTFVCSVGALAMRDAYQKLHYIATPATACALLVAAALLIAEKQKQAGLKALLVWILLTLMNGVVTHATARAARIRERGNWVVAPGEEIELVGAEEPLRGEARREEAKR